MDKKSLTFGSKDAAQTHASLNAPPAGKEWAVVVATPGNGKPQSISLMPTARIPSERRHNSYRYG